MKIDEKMKMKISFYTLTEFLQSLWSMSSLRDNNILYYRMKMKNNESKLRENPPSIVQSRVFCAVVVWRSFRAINFSYFRFLALIQFATVLSSFLSHLFAFAHFSPYFYLAWDRFNSCWIQQFFLRGRFQVRLPMITWFHAQCALFFTWWSNLHKTGIETTFIIIINPRKVVVI